MTGVYTLKNNMRRKVPVHLNSAADLMKLCRASYACKTKFLPPFLGQVVGAVDIVQREVRRCGWGYRGTSFRLVRISSVSARLVDDRLNVICSAGHRRHLNSGETFWCTSFSGSRRSNDGRIWTNYHQTLVDEMKVISAGYGVYLIWEGGQIGRTVGVFVRREEGLVGRWISLSKPSEGVLAWDSLLSPRASSQRDQTH